ncbi:MAG: S1 RNA-binding domain-containing protein [Chloroflexi bacterium]|nr:S1 RNA-binding domain-containing protein [Chloroflexota bacterium]
MPEPTDFQIGQEVDVTIIRMEDEDGNLVLSISQARQSEDWKKAEELLTTQDTWPGFVTDANRGGLIILFGNVRGFVPASHVSDLPRGLSEDERRTYLSRLVGQPINLKVIEVNRKRRRLVFSQREAQRNTAMRARVAVGRVEGRRNPQWHRQRPARLRRLR